MSITTDRCFTTNLRCPVCNGCRSDPRHQGKRCFGFLSEDGEYAHCSREEYAGNIPRSAGSSTYGHRRFGPCRCGVTHGEVVSPPRDFASGNGNGNGADHGPITALYDYRDATGITRYQVVRHADKYFAVRRPDPGGKDGWTWNMRGIGPEHRVPYRLPEVLAAPEKEPIWIAEGEKDVDTLVALGLTATCNPFGVTHWLPGYSEHLGGKTVYILYDRDPDQKGFRHAQDIHVKLSGFAKTATILDLPDDAHDVSDWVVAGGTATQLRALAAASATTAEEDNWTVPLEQEALASLEPSMLLAPSLVTFVEEARNATGFPVEFFMSPILSVLGAAIGCTFRTQVEEDWHEPPMIWSAVVAVAGSGKSPAAKMAMAPIHEMQRAWNRQWRSLMEAHQQEIAEWEATERRLRGPRPVQPVQQRILTTDATLEALARVLLNTPRGVLMEHDELAGWVNGFNMYRGKGGNDRERWLEIWSSKSFMIDRVGDSYSAYVQNPFIAISGGIQPDKLRPIIQGMSDGFSDRLLLFWPYAEPTKMTDTPRTIEIAARAGYAALVTELRNLEFAVDAYGESLPTDIPLNPGAFREFSARKNRVVDLRNDPDLNPALRNAYAKMDTHAARIAIALHLAQLLDGVLTDAGRINKRTVQAAWAIVEVSMSHLRRVYREMGADPQDVLLDRLLDWIKRHERTATIRDLMRGHAPGCTRTSGTKALLFELENRRLGKVTITKPKTGSEQWRFTLGEGV